METSYGCRSPYSCTRATQALPKGYPRDTQGIPKGTTGSQHRSNTGATGSQHTAVTGTLRSIGASPCTLQQGLGVPAGGVGLAAQHAGQFGDAVLRAEQGDLGRGATRLGLLGGQVMGRGPAG